MESGKTATLGAPSPNQPLDQVSYSDLPDLALACILSNLQESPADLGSCRLVCTRWNQLVDDLPIWQDALWRGFHINPWQLVDNMLRHLLTQKERHTADVVEESAQLAIYTRYSMLLVCQGLFSLETMEYRDIGVN